MGACYEPGLHLPLLMCRRWDRMPLQQQMLHETFTEEKQQNAPILEGD